MDSWSATPSSVRGLLSDSLSIDLRNRVKDLKELGGTIKRARVREDRRPGRQFWLPGTMLRGMEAVNRSGVRGKRLVELPVGLVARRQLPGCKAGGALAPRL